MTTTEGLRRYRPRKECPKCHGIGRLFHYYSFLKCEVCDTIYTPSTMNEVYVSIPPPEDETAEQREIRIRKKMLLKAAETTGEGLGPVE
jgi:hypothetical protein